MFRGPGSQSLHIINGPRVYIDRGNTWGTPRRHHHDVYRHVSLGAPAQFFVWITWRFIFIPAMLRTVWMTNVREFTNRRCGINAASLCERGYSQPPQVLPLPVWDNASGTLSGALGDLKSAIQIQSIIIIIIIIIKQIIQVDKFMSWIMSITSTTRCPNPTHEYQSTCRTSVFLNHWVLYTSSMAVYSPQHDMIFINHKNNHMQ